MNDNAYGAVLPFVGIEGDTAIYGGETPEEFTWENRKIADPKIVVDRRYHELLGFPGEIVVMIQDARDFQDDLSKVAKSFFHDTDEHEDEDERRKGL